jgi:sulfite reductase (NADPH) flavoprotein alpha-component
MTNIPIIPDSAPFTAEQRQWLNGFLAGMFSSSAASVEKSGPKAPLLILFGSQTGTAEGLAKKAAKEAEKRGFAAKVMSMEQYQSVSWDKESNLLVVTSTYGEGEPPDNAQTFWNWLSSDAAPQMEHIRYGVLALGDTNYEAFCEFGKKCDARFATLGARRAIERRDCDTDYETPAGEWVTAALSSLKDGAPSSLAASPAVAAATDSDVGFSKKNPYPARLATNLLLTAANSEKEVRHFEIALGDSGLTYEVGDALGIFPNGTKISPLQVSEA